jgi:hypothetical protein
MSEPSVEEIVADIERVMASREGFVCLDPDWANALVADWRKKKEALKKYGGHKTTCFAYRSHATGNIKGGYTDLKDHFSYSEKCTCGLDDALNG